MLVVFGTAVTTAVQASGYVTLIPSGEQESAQFLKVGEILLRPPPSLPGTSVPEKQGQALHDQVLSNMKQRFDAAADPVTHRLTAAGATRSGWGYVADHFKEIDRSGKGSVTFDDLEQFLRARKGAAFVQS
uniref:EF-hand domain-containing protein n=1 Tax=Burkholderia arboris TaxID=488730 RepID=UPI003BEEBB46